ncbi:MAG: glycosyltransferase, partial [Comamonadaceae bacterium]
MGGYEGADHVNGSGVQVDIHAANAHHARIDADYALLAPLGIRTIRESIGWRAFDALAPQEAERRLLVRAHAAQRAGLQVIWTLQHYGVPDGVDLFGADLAERFADFCGRVARILRRTEGDTPWFQPINEISFLSWAATATALMHPHRPSSEAQGYDLKCNLVGAALRGCDALWAECPGARIVHTDPLVHVVAEQARDDWTTQAQARCEAQYQAWDMLCGRLEPGLGGAARYLDVIGLNYYHSNQWSHPAEERLHWHLRDPRRRDPARMFADVWERYGRPLFVAETGHVGDGRARWMDDIAAAAQRSRAAGVPLQGICLYPLLDRPDWEDGRAWHRSGLWDVERRTGQRCLHIPAARRLAHWQQHLPAPDAGLSFPHTLPGSSMTSMIVFSHLRWDFVYQRPQHLLSRLAARHPVVFVEEPMAGATHAALEVLSPCEGVTVLRAHLPGTAQGFHDSHIPALQGLLAEYLQESTMDDYWLWFYTPMALPLAAGLQPQGVIYDCMDELAAFAHAPRQLLQRESALFHIADLVFTGGRALYEAKRDRNANVHCFPSSVDAAHFARAIAAPGEQPATHEAQFHIAQPRLGYFGVIDERIDLGLIAALAQAHPEWQVVMVGPVVKIDPATLPQAANLHWLGQRSYDELPELVAGWDVCLMPFALNDSTRFISPTKTLEYLAAGRPVVSTPIRDVANTYAGVVAIAEGPAAFIAACQDAMTMDGPTRAHQATARETLLAATSWDATIDAMLVLITATAAAKGIGSTPASPGGVNVRQATAGRAGVDDRYPTVILGAGPTGLAAALQAGRHSLLVEQNDTVGGWCRSIEDQGFTFDCAGHIMFSKDPDVLALYERLLGDNIHWQDREAWVYSHEVYTRYPFQSALYGLPPPVLKECLVGAIEARFGSLTKPATRLSPTGPSRAVAAVSSGSAVSDAPAPAAAMPDTSRVPANFEEFIYKVWGHGVARHFAIPYNRKLWAVPLNEMETSWLGGRVPMPDLEEMIDGALSPVKKPIGPNARFGYPLRGGFQALMDGFLPLLEGEMRLGTRAVSVSPSRRTVTFDDGRTVGFTTLISTLPLPALVAALGSEAPAYVREAARQLRHVSVRCVNLGVARENVTDKHWIYYPEETVFHRIFVQGNASPGCNPPGGFGITCEITYSPSKPLPAEGDALIQRCFDDAVKVGLLRSDDQLL